MNVFLEDRVAVLLRRRSHQVWRVFTPEQRRIMAGTFYAGLAVLAAFAFLKVIPVLEIVEGARRRHAEKSALQTYISRAKSEPVEYDAARADPSAFKGRPVVWCVDHPAAGFSYLAGRPDRPLSWSDETRLPKNSPTTGGRCDLVVATVEASSPKGLLLNFVGRP